jgi:hypothetical protein
MKVRAGLSLLLAALLAIVAANPAAADRLESEVWARLLFTPASADRIYCDAYTEVRASDGYVRGAFRSWNLGSSAQVCEGWLERKRYNSDGSLQYNWTRVSDIDRIIAETRWSGYHWNGTDAGSRVCIKNYASGEKACSYGVW